MATPPLVSAPPPATGRGSPDAATPRLDRRALYLGAVASALVLLVVAIGAGASANVGRVEGKKRAEFSSVATHAALGLGAAALLSAVTLAAFFTHQRAALDGPGQRRRALVATLPWIFGLLCLGAVLGAATTPLRDAPEEPPTPTAPTRPTGKGTGPKATDPATDSRGQRVNSTLPIFEGKVSQPTRDGVVPLAVDRNGDGSYEAPLVPCSAGTSKTPTPTPPGGASTPNASVLVPIDFQCDGTVDAYARVSVADITRAIALGPATTLRVPATRRASDPATDAAGRSVNPNLPVYDAELGLGRLSSSGGGLLEDRDGDGKLDSPLVSCPPGTGGATQPAPRNQGNGYVLVPIDAGCNGTIDAYGRVPIEVYEAARAGAAPPATNQRTTTTRAATTTTTQSADDSDRAGNSGMWKVMLWIALALGAVALIAFGVRAFLKRKRGTSEGDDDAQPDEPPLLLAPAPRVDLSNTLAQLAPEVDPREAILNAYAALLSTLADAGLPRSPAEGPEEYLRRCSASLGMAERPMTTLTRLFSVARFSTHPLGAEHVQEATHALRHVQSELTLVGARV